MHQIILLILEGDFFSPLNLDKLGTKCHKNEVIFVNLKNIEN